MTAVPGTSAHPGHAVLDDSRARDIAVDPRHSVILQAPAGSGKTSLLVRRYLALLGHVERPEQILAITFTRKAAGEMRERVTRALSNRSEQAAAAIARDERQGWHLLLQPQRIKIQTIDAFALGLARRMPAGSRFGFDANFVEDAESVYAMAVDRLFERLESDPAAPLLADFLALIDNDYEEARTLLTAMLARRDQWLDPVVAVARHAARPEVVGASVERAIRALNRSMIEGILDALPPGLLDALAMSIAFAADQLDRPPPGRLDADNVDAWRAAARLVVTGAGTPRRSLTARDGFPRQARAEKSHALEVIKALGAQGAAPRFAAIAAMPDNTLPGVEREAINCFAVALSLLKVELDQVFHDLGAVDFPELVINARAALEREGAPTDLALALDYRITHVLVDEFQDTSLGQYRLLQTLMESWHEGDGNSFFAVGDPMQSVYRFRDADVSLYQETFARGIGQVPLKALQLTTNFRSCATLVEWCNSTFAALFGDDSIDQVDHQPSIPATKGSGEVRAVVCLEDARGHEQCAQVVRRILEIRRKSPGDTIAVLVRARTALTGLLPALRRAGIPWHGKDIELLADTGVVRDLHALTLALTDPSDRFAWLCVLRSPLIGMRLPDLERAANGRSIDDMLHAPGYSGDGGRRISRLSEALARRPRDGSPRRKVEWLWLRLGGVDAYDSDTHLDDAERYLELLEEIEPTVPSALWSAVGRLYASSPAEGDGIEIMTIHKAKGLEFDHVIVPGLEKATRRPDPALVLWRPEGDDLLMATATSRENGSLYRWLLHEERMRDSNELGRLIYVAATRAAKSLTWFASLDKGVDTPPPHGSMLSMLWPLIGEQSTFVTPSGARDTGHENVAEDTPRAGSLPRDYEWTPPIVLPEVARAAPRPKVTATSTLILDQPETAIGNIVHAELKRLAGSMPSDPRAYLAAREPSWDRLLRREGIVAPEVLDEIRRQISGVLDDEAGQWLLDHARLHAESEAPYTAYIDGGLRNVVIDRTFVDDTGCRWIVDYKTARPGDSQDETGFIRSQLDRHAGQVALYARVLSQLDDTRPIRTALYLTALPRLVQAQMPPIARKA